MTAHPMDPSTSPPQPTATLQEAGYLPIIEGNPEIHIFI